MPYSSCRWPWISRVLMPRAYIETILSSKPGKRRWYLAMSCGSKLACRSRGTSSSILPVSVSTVFLPQPLRLLAPSLPVRRWSISAFNARSARAFFRPSRRPFGSNAVCGSAPASSWSRRASGIFGSLRRGMSGLLRSYHARPHTKFPIGPGRPEIFNTDQGSQFTSEVFTGVLTTHKIAISMDGKGAWRDNVFVERLWRSVKYEEVYLRAYDTVAEARTSIRQYLSFYNSRRPHSSLDRQTPDQAYFTRLSQIAAA